MKNASSHHVCPNCNSTIPAEAPGGLCPKCVLAAAAAANQDTIKSPPEETPTKDSLAALFPQLEIIGLIGRGGMGWVFKARQPRLDRHVALKLLPQSRAADPLFAERFQREGRVLAKLNHPNIVTVFDIGSAGGFFYLLMEYVDGINLREAMQTGSLRPEGALAIVPKICEALQYAHEQGVLHRDIKPENILMDHKGAIKIADFGIAKLVGDDRDAVTLTGTGSTLGTLHYMAPEQLENPATVDHRADIYSLGVVFYEMLTGQLPIGRFAPPSTRTSLDQRIDEIVLRALERERELRQKSAQEMKTEVEHITEVGALGKPAPGSGTSGSGGDLGPNGTIALHTGVPQRQLGPSRRVMIGATAALAIVAILVVFVLFPNWRGRDQVAGPENFPDSQASQTAKRDQAHEETIRLLQRRLDDARTRYSAGEVSTGEVVRAVRDLALGQARGDKLAFAKANLEYAEWLLEAARKEGDDAKIWAAELGRAEAWHAVNVAQSGGDKARTARADLDYAQTIYVLAQRHHRTGTIDENRLRAAQRDWAQAQSYLKHVLQTK